MDGTFVVPSPAGTRWSELESVPLELARQTQGRLFEKHILSTGTLIHPKTGEKIPITEGFLDTMVRNFAGNVCDIVQVPLANDRNDHVEAPAANIGETVALRKRDGKLYAVIDARIPEHAAKMGKTYLGASAFLSTNYTDSRTGKKAGPTLLHVAVTNRPYVVGLEPYQEIASLSSDIEDDELYVLTQQEEHQVSDRDELIRQLLDDHGIDVAALQASASQGLDQAALSEALARALESNPVTAALTAGGADAISVGDLAGAVVELSRQNATISRGYEDMRRERAAEIVNGLVTDGYILPKQREFAIDLKLSGDQDRWSQFVPDAPIIPVGQQTGTNDPAMLSNPATAKDEAEVARLTAGYAEYFDREVASKVRRR